MGGKKELENGFNKKDLNEVRAAAGLPVVTNYDRKDPVLQSIQSAAGIL